MLRGWTVYALILTSLVVAAAVVLNARGQSSQVAINVNRGSDEDDDACTELRASAFCLKDGDLYKYNLYQPHSAPTSLFYSHDDGALLDFTHHGYFPDVFLLQTASSQRLMTLPVSALPGDTLNVPYELPGELNAHLEQCYLLSNSPHFTHCVVSPSTEHLGHNYYRFYAYNTMLFHFHRRDTPGKLYSARPDVVQEMRGSVLVAVFYESEEIRTDALRKDPVTGTWGIAHSATSHTALSLGGLPASAHCTRDALYYSGVSPSVQSLMLQGYELKEESTVPLDVVPTKVFVFPGAIVYVSGSTLAYRVSTPATPYRVSEKEFHTETFQQDIQLVYIPPTCDLVKIYVFFQTGVIVLEP